MIISVKYTHLIQVSILVECGGLVHAGKRCTLVGIVGFVSVRGWEGLLIWASFDVWSTPSLEETRNSPFIVKLFE